MAKFEYIVFGMGKGKGGTGLTKGAVCPEPEGCPKGVPSRKEGDESIFSVKGYELIQGPNKPSRLGGARFNTEALARKWLSGAAGKKFKDTFLNVYIVRVIE